jgi:hypothetical protein
VVRFRQEHRQGAKTLGVMRLARTMFETGTFHWNCPKDGAKGDVMRPFTVTQLTAVRAVALAVQVRLHLPFDDNLLQGLQQGFAFRYRETQALGCEVISFNTSQFADGFLALVVGERDAIRRLAHDLPSLWAAPDTTPQDRQEIVRLLLDQVTVDVQGDSEQVDVTLHWAGGVKSRHRLIRPVQRYEQLSTYPRLMARIETLRHESLSFARIAERLTAEGFYPPKRTDRFTGEMIARLRRRSGR